MLAILGGLLLMAVAMLSEITRNRQLHLLISLFLFVPLLFNIAFRHDLSILRATDWLNYVAIYETIPDSISALNWGRIEPGFLFLIWLSKNIGLAAFEFYFCVTAFCLYSFYVISKKCTRYNAMLFLLLLATPFAYNFLYNTVRQGLAFSLVAFIVFVPGNGKRARLMFFSLAAISIHFSAILPVAFLLLRNLLKYRIHALVLVISPIFFVVDAGTLIMQVLEQIPLLGALSRSVSQNIIADPHTSGRMYYFIAYLFLLIKLVLLPLFSRFQIRQTLLNDFVFKKLEALIYFSVTLYPLFSSVGVLVRITSYGFALLPLYIIAHFYKAKKSENSLLLGVTFAYMFVYVISLRTVLLG